MKVLYIVNSTISSGGASKSFLTLLKGLIRYGIEPYVIVPDNNGIWHDLTEMNVQTFVLKYRHATYPNLNTPEDIALFLPRLTMRRILDWFAVRRIVNICKSYNINLIHTNVSVIDLGIRASLIVGIPHIYHFREYADIDFGEKYFPSKKAFYRLIASSKTYSICITKSIQQYHRLTEPMSQVIYNGIPIKETFYNNTKKEQFFLFAGRIEPAKGLYQLLEAFCMYKERVNSAYRLLIAGETADEGYASLIKTFIRNNGLETDVTFLGVRNDIDLLMQKATAIVIPSRFEAFGRCMPEAMSNGCIVIGHDTGGTKEQLDNGIKLQGHEIGFRYNNNEELADLLHRVTTISPQKLSEMRKGAYDTVKRLYSTEAYITNVFNFYKDITAVCDNL